MLRRTSTATHHTLVVLRTLHTLRALARELNLAQNMKHLDHIECCMSTLIEKIRKHTPYLPKSLKEECLALEEECCVLDEWAYMRIRFNVLDRCIVNVLKYNRKMCGVAHSAIIERFYNVYRTMKDNILANDLENQFTVACERFEHLRDELLEREYVGLI
jgi:hypothetical protein